MPEQAGSGRSRSWLKTSCLGCLILVGLPVVILLFLVLVNVAVGKPESVVEDRTLTREIESPAAPAVPLTPGETGPGREAALAAPLNEAYIGELVLDIREGSFTIVPGEPGTAVRVEGRFDTGSHELTDEYTQSGELGWRHEIRFGPKRGWWLRLLTTEDTPNRLRITIPRGLPLKLTGYAGLGEFDMEFGGLYLVEADLELGAGEHKIRFSEPLAEPARSIVLDGSFGAASVRELGNASPERFGLTQTAGELRVDLAGEWRNDSEVTVQTTFGEIRIGAPDNARLVVDQARVTMGEKRIPGADRRELPEDAPEIRLVTGLTAGEIRIQ